MDEPKADLYPAMRGSREYWDAKREAELVALRAERDQFKAMWERDSTALGKALAQRDTARVDAEDKRARVAAAEAVLRALRDAAEASDDSLYGTLGTGFVRSVVDGALGLSGNKPASLPEGT